MIISGGARGNWRFFAKHLTRADENEVVRVAEMRGLVADTVLEALREMDAVAMGTRATNFFYHADINPREDERLTEEQWEKAVDALEANLGLNGHARFVVEHEKKGRTHRHVVWSRVDTDTMTVVPVEDNYASHERTSRELEDAFGLEPTPGVYRDGKRAERRPDNWEVFRGQRSGIDPRDVKAELTDLWRQADTGRAFAAALEERGYILAKGDRRDFIVIDHAGDDHSLGRRVGVKAAEVRARMADIDRDALPSVEEARKMARSRPQERPGPEEAQPEPDPVPPGPSPEPGQAASHAEKRRNPEQEPPPSPAQDFDQLARRYIGESQAIRELARSVVAVTESTLSQIERAAQALKRWRRGGDPSLSASLKRLEERVGPQAAPMHNDGTKYRRIANATKRAMRENGGELPMPGAMNFWQRAVAMLQEVGGQAVTLVKDTKDKVTGFVSRLLHERNTAREHETEIER